jgi:hypothetical protein
MSESKPIFKPNKLPEETDELKAKRDIAYAEAFKSESKPKELPEETDELRAKRDIAYAGAFNTKPYYACLSETKTSSEWSTKGLAGHYGYNVYDDF